MGIYCYTLRKKAVNVHSTEGRHRAQLFAYAYKEWLTSSWDDRVERRRDAIRNRASTTAARAAEGGISELVVLGDKPQDGAPVYADVRQSLWFDGDTFPGRLVGFLRKQGGRWQLVDATPWEQWHSGGTAYWNRDRISEDGQRYRERIEAATVPQLTCRTAWDLPGQEPAALTAARTEKEIEVRVCW